MPAEGMETKKPYNPPLFGSVIWFFFDKKNLKHFNYLMNHMNTLKPADGLLAVRNHQPLVHNITNHVVMNFSANTLLAAGASPVMAHAKEEAADMARLADALVLNIGTLSPHWIEAMHIALEAARDKGIPVILDPVGAGATTYRTETAYRLLDTGGISVLRGNASEILALAKAGGSTKGVDSTDDAGRAIDAIHALAEERDVIISTSGKIDHIIGKNRHIRVHNGTALMSRITGMGCSSSALTGAFCAVNEDYLSASAHAMAIMGITGEAALEQSNGPGSFQSAFLDQLAVLNEETITRKVQIDEKFS